MTTTVNSNESKVFTNRIGFSGSFYKFLGEDIKIGYASNVQKELRDKARKEEQKQKELKEIEEEKNKAITKAQKEYEIKKAVVSFGISWDNVIFYDHRNEVHFNFCDCYKKIPSDLINEFICTNVLPEDINVVNDDKGR